MNLALVPLLSYHHLGYSWDTTGGRGVLVIGIHHIIALIQLKTGDLWKPQGVRDRGGASRRSRPLLLGAWHWGFDDFDLWATGGLVPIVLSAAGLHLWIKGIRGRGRHTTVWKPNTRRKTVIKFTKKNKKHCKTGSTLQQGFTVHFHSSTLLSVLFTFSFAIVYVVNA